MNIPTDRRFVDLRGLHFGRLTVADYAGKSGTNHYWTCKCDCGSTCIVGGPNLKAKIGTKSCGCMKSEKCRTRGKAMLRSIAGLRFGQLLGISDLDGGDGICLCDCGRQWTGRRSRLFGGKTTSCGCKKVSHGQSRQSEYGIWNAMIERCHNEKSSGYKWYGAKGISVCDRWRNKFENFLQDMGKRPKGMSIERKDRFGNYEPSNCCWATSRVQARNTSQTTLFTCFGKTQCLQDWADEFNMDRTTIYHRICRGWDVEKAISTPPAVRLRNRLGQWEGEPSSASSQE